MSRIRALLALTAIAAASLVGLAAPAAHANANAYFDSSSDSSPYDARGDIVTIGANYSADGNVLLATKTAQPVNPATDYNWVTNTSAIIWNIDITGDNQEDYWAIISTSYNGDVTAHVWRTGGNSPVCTATTGFNASGVGVYIYFPGSCIASPARFSIQSDSIYDRGSNSSSYDYAPNDSSFVAAVTPSDSTTTTTQPPTTTTTTQPQPDPTVHVASHGGYWIVARNGHVSPFGAPTYGDAPTSQATHIEPTPDGAGYWVLAANGDIFPFGDAPNLGNAGMFPGENAVSLSATPNGTGYWVFTDRGRVVPFGNAQPFGDMSGTKLNGPILGSVATPSGDGYWMVGSDGGIFSFGDATFHGSTGATKLNRPVMAMAPAADGSGYWLVASDGGIFAFDVPFYGSMGGTRLNKPISGMVPGSGGYMMVGQDGGVFSFGNVAYHGSLGGNPSPTPIVSAALQP